MHKVELRKGFTGDRRNRAGLTVTRTEPFQGDVTKEQLKALSADPELVVTEVKMKPVATKKPAAKKKTATKGKASTVRQMVNKLTSSKG